jgi:hypothetical protein
MMRDDTPIRGTEQGQLSPARGTIILHLQPVVRRPPAPKQREGAILGQILDNTISVDENTNHAASRAIASEWFWDP